MRTVFTTFPFRSVGLMFAACAVLFVAGCAPTGSPPCEDDADCPDGRCRFGACGPVCEEDLDCGSRQICVDGACAPRPECARDDDCASGFRCAEGTCRCTSDQACALNQSCVAGVCQTRARCTQNADCPANQRCELTQGLCMPPCAFATDCAPGLDPQLAVLLYTCREGNCLRACVNDATCGSGLICADGLCDVAQCETKSDCAAGQYCTSAINGRCQGYETCSTNADCAPNHECRPFSELECPPGFPCEQALCQELPRCFADGDCTGLLPGQTVPASYCADGHCQRTTGCAENADCGADQACVGGICVPGGCRGHADCPATQACVGGECRSAPPAINFAQLSVNPRQLRLVQGETTTLQVIGLEPNVGTFPLATANYEILDASGGPSSTVTVSPTGVVTAVSPGSARIRVTLEGALVQPVEARVDVLPSLTTGRRVSVVDAATRRPLAGVTVIGCDAPPSDAPCPAPIEVSTDATGTAHFPGFTGAHASFSVASSELRADGLPRYEIVSIARTGAHDVLVPLGTNPVETAAGFNAVINFNQVQSNGNYWLGFAALSAGDPSDVDLQTLLGETFYVSLPGVPQRLPVPGSVVLYTSPGFDIPNEVKPTSLGLGQPGRRAAVAFAGRTTSAAVLGARSTDLLSYAGAFEQAFVPFSSIESRPRVLDTADVDGDGLCAQPMQCPQGSETVPDYASFTQLSFSPRYSQSQRTEIVVAEIPAEFDTVVYAATQTTPETGALPHGLSSKTAPAPTGGVRVLPPVVLRSGAARDGTEAGLPGTWVMAVQSGASATGTGAESGRLTLGATLPTRVVVPPLLPTAPGSTFEAQTRSFAPAQPAWNALVSAGGELVRVDLVGAQVRHRVWFPAEGAQTRIRVPDAPALGVTDPANDPGARVRVAVLDLVGGVSPDDALSLPGGGMDMPSVLIDGYSRW